jgi:hypothetical protein
VSELTLKRRYILQYLVIESEIFSWQLNIIAMGLENMLPIYFGSFF